MVLIVTLGQQYHVGEKHTVILLYTYINRHAGTQNKTTKTKDTMSLYYSSVCNIESWVVWVSMNEIYYLIIVIDVQRYTLLVSKLSNIEL